MKNCILLMLSLCCKATFAVSDRILIKNTNLIKLGIFTSYFNTNDKDYYTSNFKGTFNNQADLEFVYNKYENNKNVKYFNFKQVLSYLTYVDSITIKSNDIIRLNLKFNDFISGNSKFSFSAYSTTQLLPSYQYIRKNDIVSKRLKGKMFNPSTTIIGYGYDFRFWTDNFITVSFASIKVETKSRFLDKEFVLKDYFAKTNNTYFTSDYGCSVTTNIRRYFNNVLWINQLTFFANKIGKDGISIDLLNTVAFDFFKFAEIKTDLFSNYNFYKSPKFIHTFQVTLGLYLQNRNGKLGRYNVIQ